MDEIEQRLCDRTDRNAAYGEELRGDELRRPELKEILSSKEVRRQLGWFLISGHGPYRE